MKSDDGEWIRAEADRQGPAEADRQGPAAADRQGPAAADRQGPAGADRQGPAGADGRPDEEWPAHGWSAAYLAPAAGSASGPATGSAAGKRWGHGGIPGFSGWVAAAVAVVAAAAGVVVGLCLIRGTPSASAVGGAAPSASAEAPSAPASAESGGQLRILLTGRVLAISRTSITIGGAGPSVTAAVTSATTVTGRVRDIGGVKAGDEVSAQLSGNAARLTATAIQDPAQ